MNGFDLAYLAAAPAFLANAWWKRFRKGKYKRSLPGMFGANLPAEPLPKHRERVWMHSVSFGETVASAAVFRVLKERRRDWEFLATTTTETGQDQALRGLKDADYHDFVPVDLSWKVRTFLDRYRPSVYLFFETEIWPNILSQTGRRGMPVILVNGKLSERSARRYAQLRFLFGGPLSNVSMFLMQTDLDADRMRRVVGPSAKIHVTGNVKFDNLPQPLSAEERQSLRADFGIPPDTLLFLAGSTHDGEEKLILEAFRKYKSHGGPPARLMIAPRHPERFAAVTAELEKLGAKARRLSLENTPQTDDDVLILDRMGVLGRSFGAADVAIVGGAWNPIGGHNLLEPAAHGIPVIHGPHMHEQKEIMRIVNAAGATRQVPADLLDEALFQFARSESLRKEFGEKGRHAAAENAGAAHRSADLILDHLLSLSAS